MKSYRYETVIIYNSDLDEQGLNAQIEKVEALVAQHGGTVEKKDIWGRRELAYKISKKSHGSYVVLVFSGDKDVVATLDRQLKINESVLRHIIVDKDKFAPDWVPGRRLDDTLPMDGLPIFGGEIPGRGDDFLQ